MQNIKFFMDMFNPTQNTNFFFCVGGGEHGLPVGLGFFFFWGQNPK